MHMMMIFLVRCQPNECESVDCVIRILSGLVQIVVTTSLNRDGIKDAIRTVVVID